MTAPNYSDEFWMSMALQEAELAASDGEIPVGAVVVKDGQLIAKGRNAPVALADPTAHAEVLALRAAAQILGNYRLEGCTLYVTLEPCAMCSGAIFNGRISRVVYGATEPKTGAAGSVINLFSLCALNHQTIICGGILADQCSALLVDFFTKRRRQQARAKESQRPFLRDDALRTPDSAFEGFDSYPLHAFAYLSDLPSLSGLRMHYVDQGPSDAPITWLCLHSSLRWSYVFNRLLSEFSSSARVVAPDLIGFGRSDKPKKESFHQIERHQQVLLDFVERLQLKRLVLVLDGWDEGVGLLLCAKIASYVEGILVFTDGVECDRSPESMLINDAPFPDSGHRAAPRVFFKIQREIEGKPFLKSSRSYFSNVKKLFCIGSDSDLNFKFFQKNIDFISFDETDESSFGKFLIKVKNSFISL